MLEAFGLAVGGEVRSTTHCGGRGTDIFVDSCENAQGDVLRMEVIAGDGDGAKQGRNEERGTRRRVQLDFPGSRLPDTRDHQHLAIYSAYSIPFSWTLSIFSVASLYAYLDDCRSHHSITRPAIRLIPRRGAHCRRASGLAHTRRPGYHRHNECRKPGCEALC